ncbi:MAG: hypothetical protein IJ932_06470 [Ruminococcus sp.]|nr:hypothetical protein [Ruminococcus sp.]
MMNKIQNKQTLGEFVFAAIIITAVLLWGKECAQGALNGIFFCAEVLIPSIFPFMIISVFIAESGLSEKLGKLTGKICPKLFGVSGNLSAVIIMSMIGGYPVGARGISTLAENGRISKNDAVKASYFAVGAGPGFLITFVGGELLSNRSIGVCMLAAQILSVIIIGILNKFITTAKSDYNSCAELNNPPVTFTSAVTKSVTSSAYGMLEMCGMVVAFSAVIGIAEKLPADSVKYFSVFLEVTTACNLLAENNNILFIAFATGFGGLCVHFQIFTALKNIKINKALFFLCRIIQGFLSALLTFIFIKIFNISLPVFSSVKTPLNLSLSTSAVGSALLILCAVSFIYSIKKL